MTTPFVAEYWRDLDSKHSSSAMPFLPNQDFSPVLTKATKIAKETRYATVTTIPADGVRLMVDQKKAVDAELAILKQREGRRVSVSREVDSQADQSSRSRSPCLPLMTPLDQSSSRPDRKGSLLAKETRYATVANVPSDVFCVAPVVSKRQDDHMDCETVVGPDNSEVNHLTSSAHPKSSASSRFTNGVVSMSKRTSLFRSKSSERSTSRAAESTPPATAHSKIPEDHLTSDASDGLWSRIFTGTALVAGGTICSIILVATMQRQSIGAPMR